MHNFLSGFLFIYLCEKSIKTSSLAIVIYYRPSLCARTKRLKSAAAGDRVIAAIGLGRRSRPILNRSAVSTRSTQPSRNNRQSKSPGDSASMRNLRGIVSFTFNCSPHGARRGCSYRGRGMYSHSVGRFLPWHLRSRRYSYPHAHVLRTQN